MWQESNYFKSLESSDKIAYKKKLTLTLPDPYLLETGWEDVKLLPDLDSPDIYHYLINTPSEFTKESLKAYKSLEAYKSFISGHVQDVYYHSLEGNKEFCFIKTKVNKSE